MTRVLRRVRPQAYDVRLDDLFRYEDAGPVRQLDDPAKRPWIVRAALYSFIASAIVYTLFHVANLNPPYPLILAVCAGSVLVRRAVRLVSEPPWLRTHDAVRPMGPSRRLNSGGWYEGGDGMLDAVRRWDRRLEWGVTAPERFAHTVSSRLGELADVRLRQRHGITRASDPSRARALLGDEAWAMLHGPIGRVPNPNGVAAVVRRLEEL